MTAEDQYVDLDEADAQQGAKGAKRGQENGAADEDIAAVVERLAKLSRLEYDRVRLIEADRLGVRVSSLDSEVVGTRRRAETANSEGPPEFPSADPATDSVDGAELLADLERFLTQHVVLPKGGATAMALWIVHTWTHDSAECSPLLVFMSPEKRCGKTSALRVLNAVCARPVPASNISAAALFRAVEKWRPTLLVDEADSFLDNVDEMRGLLNSGHTRDTAYVIRAVERNGDFEPVRFSTWAPKAIALIGRLADTLIDRAIVIPMKRKRSDEKIARFRLSKNDPATAWAATLRRRLARWAQDNSETLRQAQFSVLEGLNDRAADNWSHMFAIADLVGGPWPEKARQAALALSGGDTDETESVRTLLLGDIRDMFAATDDDALASADITAQLGRREDRPWSEWKVGKPITPRQIATLLRPFGIKPGTVRLKDGNTPKGVRTSTRCSPATSPLPIRHSATTRRILRKNAILDPPHQKACGGLKMARIPRKPPLVALWRIEGGGSRGGDRGMDRMTLLGEAYAAGLTVIANGDKLVVRGPRRAEPIARKLLAHKSEVMAVLASALSPAITTEAANWIEMFSERAALRQFQAGYRRDVAEHLAFAECIEAWCWQHPLLHDLTICAGCRKPLAGEALDLADGARVHWERNREFSCLIAAGFVRKERAVKALTAMGLTPPPGWQP